MNTLLRNLIIWLFISIAMIALFNMFNKPNVARQRLSYSDFLNKLKNDEIIAVKIEDQKITGILASNKRFVTYYPNDPKLVDKLISHEVQIEVKPKEESPWYMNLLVSWFPMLLLIGIWIFFMRQMQGGAGGGRAFSFGRSRAKLISEGKMKVTFDDVAGVDEAKEELQEVVEFLKNPKKFTKLGGRIPKGVLLVGPPGTGKTLLAKAVAGEAGVPFFSISGSDFVEMFVGVGAARVRDLFIQGKRNAPCLIFIDEIDAVGRQRGAGLGGGHDEREQTLNQLLVEMDGFEPNEGVIIIAATNRPDVLDPALLRPGRFDRQVVVPIPDLKGRRAILEVYAQKVALGDDVDLDIIARGTPGFSGADLENMINEAALIAAKKDKNRVEMEDIEEAKDKVLMGKERKSIILSEEEKKITAFHEGGHALTAKMLPKADPIHKVSIIPRGRALGITMQLPIDERHNYTKEYLETTLTVLLGGRAAEEIFLGEQSTGASNDLEKATKIARKMICEWGMCDRFGTVAWSGGGQEVFLGRDLVQYKYYSEETAKLIDEEIKKTLDKAYSKAKLILKENKQIMYKLVDVLLERETITGDELDKIIKGEDLPPMKKQEKSDEEDKDREQSQSDVETEEQFHLE